MSEDELSLEDQKWQLESGVCLDTREVFARLVAQEIEKSELCWSENTPDKQPLSLRFPLIGPYGILKVIGEGAFGRVYIGFDAKQGTASKKGKMVAIKAPTDNLLRRYAEAAQRSEKDDAAMMWARLNIGELFSKEAFLTGSLSTCPYVVSVLDHSISYPYLVLEYCNEGSLTKRLTRPYDEQTIYDWGYQIAFALNTAHSLRPQSLVHRDLKPDNILLDNGQLKVSDFGTSELVSQTESLQSIHSGYTPVYAAPEAFDGKTYPATDIWSLGVILYQIVSLRLPFTAKTPVQLMKQITVDQPVPLLDLPGIGLKDEVYPLIEACLEKDPSKRPKAEECLEMFGKLSKIGVDPREQELQKKQRQLEAEQASLKVQREKIELERRERDNQAEEEREKWESEKKRQMEEMDQANIENKSSEQKTKKEKKSHLPMAIFTLILFTVGGFFWLEHREEQFKKMTIRFTQIRNKSVSSSQELDLWQKFLKNYSANYPKSEKDEIMRAHAKKRINSLKAGKRNDEKREGTGVQWWDDIKAMEAEFKKLQKQTGSLEEQISRWEKFQEKYKKDIYPTSRDNEIRALVTRKMKRLKENISRK